MLQTEEEIKKSTKLDLVSLAKKRIEISGKEAVEKYFAEAKKLAIIETQQLVTAIEGKKKLIVTKKAKIVRKESELPNNIINAMTVFGSEIHLTILEGKEDTFDRQLELIRHAEDYVITATGRIYKDISILEADIVRCKAKIKRLAYYM